MQIRRDDHVCTSEIIEVHIVTGFAVALFTQRWTDLLIFGIIFAGIVAVLFLCVLLQETCDSLREKIRAL